MVREIEDHSETEDEIVWATSVGCSCSLREYTREWPALCSFGATDVSENGQAVKTRGVSRECEARRAVVDRRQRALVLAESAVAVATALGMATPGDRASPSESRAAAARVQCGTLSILPVREA